MTLIGENRCRCLGLQYFYRAMVWLGEEAEENSPGRPASCCVKDVIEERLFIRRPDAWQKRKLLIKSVKLRWRGGRCRTKSLTAEHVPAPLTSIVPIASHSTDSPQRS